MHNVMCTGDRFLSVNNQTSCENSQAVEGRELPGLKTREQPFAALPVLLPQPLCHSFEHPVNDMKAGTLKMASAQVSISEQSYINIWGTRRLIIGCFVNQSGQRIHHSRHHCQEPGGVKDKEQVRSSIEILP